MANRIEYFYDRFSTVYPLVNLFLAPQKRILLEEINKQSKGVLLEIGVGDGSHLHLYKKHQVIGIDSSSNMLNKALKKHPQNVQLFKMDGEHLLFESEKFDYVVLSHVIAVVENPDRLLNEVFRVLKPGGLLFILNHFTPGNWLKYFDFFFRAVSKKFYFRSYFIESDLIALNQFAEIKRMNFPPMSYFKLLIYRKG